MALNWPIMVCNIHPFKIKVKQKFIIFKKKMKINFSVLIFKGVFRVGLTRVNYTVDRISIAV